MQVATSGIAAAIFGGLWIIAGLFLMGPGARLNAQYSAWLYDQPWSRPFYWVYKSPETVRSVSRWASRVIGLVFAAFGLWMIVLGFMR